MANIITPLSLFGSFENLLETNPQTIGIKEENGIRIEYLTFYGRDTGVGRVKIYAAYASGLKSDGRETVIIFPDSSDTIDEGLMKLFTDHGYSALMVDYRGEWDGCERYTQYPSNIEYANTINCGRHKDFVDESADKTSWYEWVAVGIYADKYLHERNGNDNVAVVGLRDGGEIAWKLAVWGKFKCIVPVCAAGWRAYAGINKFTSDKPALDDERYRFIAGIDSQAYAPHVKCPVLMLCSTNDPRFDYDRAYDTYSRINPDYIQDSIIAYSVQCNVCIGIKSTADMFMFLDKNLKNRHVFLPRPAEVTVEADSEQNLVARAVFDDQGEVESCSLYLAEDCLDSARREWAECPLKRKISYNEHEFYLNIYEKTTTVFVLCYSRYTNGFTVWSKVVAKKIGGRFKNMQSKCRVLLSGGDGIEGFAIADFTPYAVGKIFFTDEKVVPSLVTKAKGVKGLYSVGGLTTFRMNNPRFSPPDGSVLKLDIYCDKTTEINLTVKDLATGVEYYCALNVLGEVWQSFICESPSFKSSAGAALEAFTSDMQFALKCDCGFALNNMMWL